MKTINYCFTDYGTLFWSDNWYHYIHENDATWRPEYFDPIMNFLNVKFIMHDNIPNNLIKFVEEIES